APAPPVEGETPLERWARNASYVRYPEAGLDLDELFLFAAKRRVQKDRTVSLNGVAAWPRVVAYLIEHGAEVDIVDALGKSPLDAARGDIGGRDNVPSEEIAALLRTALAARTD